MSFIFIPTSSGIDGSNTYLGAGALRSSIGCQDWTAIGFNAAAILENGQGGIAIGSGALSNTLSNSLSVGIGYQALRDASGNRNIGIGPNAGEAITTGSSNVLIGGFDGAGIIANVQTGTNNIVLSDGSGNIRYAYLSDIPAGIQDHVFRAGAGAGSEVLRIKPAITGASTNALLSIAGTWNTTGAANGIRLNVTDTASAAGALLMDLQIGGASRISFEKGTAPQGGVITFGSPTSTTITGNNIVGLQFRIGNFASITMDSIGIAFNTSNNGATYLGTDALNTLAQRNGVNAQTLRVYNTFTDASNYERARFAWNSNVLTIGTENAGTGLARALEFYTNGVIRGSFSASASSFAVRNGTEGIALSWNATLGFLLENTGVGGFNNMSIGEGRTEALILTTRGSGIIYFRTAAGTATAVERARIDATGNFVVNTGAIATSAINGFLYVPGCAGTPTGVPTAYTGRVPIVVDTTNNKLYFYSGGAWRDAGP